MKKLKFVFKPVFVRGKWVARRVRFNPKNYDSRFTTRRAAERVCQQREASILEQAAMERRAIFRKKALAVLVAATPEELDIIRCFVVRLIDKNL